MADQSTESVSSLVDEFDRGSRAPGGGGGGGIDWSKVRLVVIGLLAVAGAGVLAIRFASGDRLPSTGSESRRRTVIDASTGDVLQNFAIRDGDTLPWKNPSTGEYSLYPVETCHWTRDGRAKLEPTYVLLNEYVGEPGPTICPDCGRRVVSHNELPPDELMIQAAEAARESRDGR